MNVTITACTEYDAETILDIGYETFDETFRDQNTPEAMKAYLDEAFTIPKIEGELNHPESRFYFLYAEENLAGYLKVNTGEAQTEEMGEDTAEIERIYVRSRFQKQGLGKVLYNKALEIAKEQEKEKIWLGVWETNRNAISFYAKMGFEQVNSHSFYMGEEEQTDYIMIKHLD
ncbi:GNAT family N-acetyltransferase [Salimicrobium halophilum]|uniref:Ribosomal protein S18 acetylase RimI n=1 Tax=Salimicrobium halophilum TaxID=86666 RepID=A0A1G8V942_9BACI|nr:GNAT family N-acetyltransferase [Salimicrobium halophilum]SDJ62636.1 Ribosomal protein S18 acetylase RimI [Salimicrobium halophilum]